MPGQMHCQYLYDDAKVELEFSVCKEKTVSFSAVQKLTVRGCKKQGYQLFKMSEKYSDSSIMQSKLSPIVIDISGLMSFLKWRD